MAADAEGGPSSPFGTLFFIVLAIVLVLILVFGMSSAPFEPSFLNIEYFFDKFASFGEDKLGWNTGGIGDFIYNLKLLAGFLSIFFTGLGFWLFLRLLEMEGEHAEHVYHHAIDSHAVHAGSGEAPFMDRLFYGEDADLMEKKVGETPTQSVPYYEGETFSQSQVVQQQEKPGTHRWNMVLKHIRSENPSDWKLAIIEADTILDAMTEGAGFPGLTLGERLRNADPGLFRTLQSAGDAHGVRNRIAHDGSGFQLTTRERDHVIRLYEDVFREFDYI
jgi:hypothetical protein